MFAELLEEKPVINVLKHKEAHADTWERAATQSDILSYRCREQSHRGEQPE